MADTSLLAMCCPVCRRRDAHAGSRMERENLNGDAKGKGASGSPVRPKVPMRRSGADGFVGARKRGNARGAKGVGHRGGSGSTGHRRNPPMLDGRRQLSTGGTSRMTRECPVRFCEGCDPFSRNLERSKGMRAKGSVRTFENLMGVWVWTSVQLPPSGCMRDGSTLMPSPDTRRHGTRQGCTAGRSRARLEMPVSHVTRGRDTNVLLNRRQNRPAKAG